MTQLLSHAFAHFIGSSYNLKANNQPKIKNLGLALTCIKVVKNCKILTFMPYPCSQFYFDINFGDRLYSNEKRPGSPLVF